MSDRITNQDQPIPRTSFEGFFGYMRQCSFAMLAYGNASFLPGPVNVIYLGILSK